MYDYLTIVLSTLASEDLACLAAGNFAAHSRMTLAGATAAALSGIFLGDLLLYGIGYCAGQGAMRIPWIRRRVSKESLAGAQAWFAARGGKAVFLSRFLPGTRLPTYLMAGILRMPVVRFASLLFLAALLWVPMLVFFAYWTGSALISEGQSYSAFIGVGVSMAAGFGLLSVYRRLASFRTRRRLYGRLQRLVRWEFWPMLWLYFPVSVYLSALALRHRRLLAFTAANPGIPDSGIRGESKSAILAALKPAQDQFGCVAPYEKIEGHLSSDVKLQLVLAAMKRLHLQFPIVLKPDAGERGKGVVIARHEASLVNYVRSTREAFIVQKFIEGREFGIFYYRYPYEQDGRIFAITDKRLLTLLGDGVQDLETLILRDERAVCMAEFHLAAHAAELRRIIPAGTEYPLVELGTHCRGALFLDGSHLITPDLTREIDRISKNFQGFFFGRYDVRVPDEHHLSRGEQISVLELNGVTSEATSIYDPRHSILFAWRTLFKQWRIATEIGMQNISRGHRTIAVKRLLKLAL